MEVILSSFFILARCCIIDFLWWTRRINKYTAEPFTVWRWTSSCRPKEAQQHFTTVYYIQHLWWRLWKWKQSKNILDISNNGYSNRSERAEDKNSNTAREMSTIRAGSREFQNIQKGRWIEAPTDQVRTWWEIQWLHQNGKRHVEGVYANCECVAMSPSCFQSYC